MGLNTLPPQTMHINGSGKTTILQSIIQPKLRYMILAMQLVSTKGSRVITILENGVSRWQGYLKQKESIRIDFGSTGWRLLPDSTLEIETSGKITMDVNILQWEMLP